jgi:hypothetical protein
VVNKWGSLYQKTHGSFKALFAFASTLGTRLWKQYQIKTKVGITRDISFSSHGQEGHPIPTTKRGYHFHFLLTLLFFDWHTKKGKHTSTTTGKFRDWRKFRVGNSRKGQSRASDRAGEMDVAWQTHRETLKRVRAFFLLFSLLKVMCILLQPTCFPLSNYCCFFFAFLVIVMRVGEETKSLLDGWMDGRRDEWQSAAATV